MSLDHKDGIDWTRIEGDVVSRLQPFQRRTVEWAFSRIYPANGTGGSGRFLVADEVGLGKTMVAKGVIVKALRYLEHRVDRADVVYICSNAEIAAQNLARLRIDGLPAAQYQSQGRLTLLPLIPNGRTSALNARGFNFLSLTPSTSFTVGRDVGQARERALLCRMVKPTLGISVSDVQLRNLFANRASADGFQRLLDTIDNNCSIDPDLQAAFNIRLQGQPDVVAILRTLCDLFKRKGELSRRDEDTQTKARRLIGRLREILAEVCIEALEPDLIVLDEFQRFPQLLDAQDDDSKLAQQLFKFPGARLLMLSATPYRLWADATEDPSGNGHHQEFLKTIGFLFGQDDSALDVLKRDLGQYNLLLRRLAQGEADASAVLQACRHRISDRLLQVMSRTDRVPATVDRDAMITVHQHTVAITAEDALAYVHLQRVATQLHQPDLIEYWRSAPYPLSFLSGYKLRDKLVVALESADPSLTEALQGSGLFLPDKAAALDALPNARCREMARTLIDAGLHRLPWIPPALPHHVLGGPFAGIGDAARTKRLLFSSWRMVPRAVSVLVDAAFQQALAAEGVKEAADRHVISGNDDAVAQPCQDWATRFDPLRIADALARSGVKPTPQAMAAHVEQEVAADVSSLWDKFGDADVHQRDDRWYWMAPLLTDAQSAVWRGWSTHEVLNVALGSDSSDDALTSAGLMKAENPATRADRRVFAQQVLVGERRLGRMPDDLASVLSMLALAGPATCLLRATEHSETVELAVRFAAGRESALALLSYLGHSQSVGLLQHLYPAEPAFWRRVLSLCLDGAWQAVLDEYLGVLELNPPASDSSDDAQSRWLAMPARLIEVLRLKPSVLRPERLVKSDNHLQLQGASVTLRHARPLLETDDREDTSDGVSSMTALRDAFNSPFMPFVLSSTSVGQEGLDFHTYCHAIVHWNVPQSPVDFEQRDGRIHRYRNHAVRRNLAYDWGACMLDGAPGEPRGNWKDMFSAAESALIVHGLAMDGMKPSWIYRRSELVTKAVAPDWMREQQGSAAAIERHVPMMPFSEDFKRYRDITRAVGCYRLVFAQPRQEDLLAHLLAAQNGGNVELESGDLSIDLRPPSS